MGFNTGMSEDDVEEIRREYEVEIDEAQAEIARLQAEVEEWKGHAIKRAQERNTAFNRIEVLQEERDTARNDALDEAADRMDLLYQKYKELGEFTKCDALDEAEQEIRALIR